MAALVAADDVTDVLARVVEACAQRYPSEAVAILVLSRRGELELLAARSHEVKELELLQIQVDRGPCVDVLAEGLPVVVDGPEALVERWAEVGEAVVAAGYGGAHAYPMHWRGRPVGGLNVFVRPGVEPDPELGRLFADLATVAVLSPQHLSTDELVDRIAAAVDARAVVEQAKGVVAYQQSVDLPTAYTVLVAEARAAGMGLRAYAEDVVRRTGRA